FEILRGSKFFQNKKLVSILLNRGNSIIHLNREQGTGNREQPGYPRQENLPASKTAENVLLRFFHFPGPPFSSIRPSNHQRTCH
ncbi:hypothetical protein, partial [Akkermansia sp.]|uniref:hypothetical protein n=1 Tax=Akkermansia sp. TaxID=1872421 RepID=UPI003AB0778C